MSEPNLALSDQKIKPAKPGRIGAIAIYLVFLAVVLRTLISEDVGDLLPQYLGLELVYILLFSVMMFIPPFPGYLVHLYFVIQSILVFWLLSFQPIFDFVILLYFMLCYQVSLYFQGRTRWIWVAILVFFTGGSLIYFLGFLRGLALSLTTMAVEIVVTAYLIVNQETEAARSSSQVMLKELQEAHQKLELYASQLEELAAMQERNRPARELHDAVSQLIFSISLTARSAQILLKQDQARVSAQLNQLQTLTSEALSQLRAFIAQLRPPP